jgi:hypothetical protein
MMSYELQSSLLSFVLRSSKSEEVSFVLHGDFETSFGTPSITERE